MKGIGMSGVKKKRVSKKNKASWRKYSDIKDVEDFLEDQRLEERIGKAELKADDELFTVDTLGDKDKALGDKTKEFSRKQKRRENAKKPPRSLAILNNTSKVQDPISKRNHVKRIPVGKDVVSKILAEKKTTKRVIQSMNDSKNYSRKLLEEKKKKDVKIFRNNLWEEKTELDDHPEFKNDWIDNKLAVYHLQNTSKHRVSRPDIANMKTTRARALELPHPGMSYNPSLEDHQDLIKEVIERESKIIKEEEHLKRVTVAMFSRMSQEERDLENLRQAASGLPTEDEVKEEDDVKEEISSDVDQLSVNPPVQNKKKDRKARRKQREQRQLLQERLQKKLEKKKVTDIHRLRALTAMVTDETEKTKEIMKRRKQKAKQRNYEPRRLAKVKFQEPEIPINMIPDLSGNLRNLKPEASILVDRFKSMQRRNILAPSVDVGIRKRRKIKRFPRSSHKEELPQPAKKSKGK